jgi:hypothetical protein
LLVRAHAIDREAFTFASYDLDVHIESEQQRLAVRGKITLRNDSTSPQRNLTLQISSSLDWRSIQLDGKPVQFISQPYTSDIDHTGALSEAIVTLPREVSAKSIVELEIGYEGIIPLDATRLTRIGLPEERARHSDWDQIGKSFTAVRGIGYVVWYPVATESANLSEGDSVFETVARWKTRELEARMKIALTHSGEGTPATLLCNGQHGGLQSNERISRFYSVTTECVFQPVGETVPLFVIGPYEGLDQPPVNISYLPDHKAAAQTYALAAQLAAPFVSEWFGAPKGGAEVRAEVAELGDPGSGADESARCCLTPLNSDSKLPNWRRCTSLLMPPLPAPPDLRRPAFCPGQLSRAESGCRRRPDFMDCTVTALAQAEKRCWRKSTGRRWSG